MSSAGSNTIKSPSAGGDDSTYVKMASRSRSEEIPDFQDDNHTFRASVSSQPSDSALGNPASRESQSLDTIAHERSVVFPSSGSDTGPEQLAHPQPQAQDDGRATVLSDSTETKQKSDNDTNEDEIAALRRQFCEVQNRINDHATDLMHNRGFAALMHYLEHTLTAGKTENFRIAFGLVLDEISRAG